MFGHLFFIAFGNRIPVYKIINYNYLLQSARLSMQSPVHVVQGISTVFPTWSTAPQRSMQPFSKGPEAQTLVTA